MLIGGIVAALVVAGIVVGVVVRRRSHDDAHSVEHYHRKLHTLEEMRAHPHTVGGATAANGNGHEAVNGSSDGDADASGPETTREESASAGGRVSYPASAVRISGSSTVRLTDASQVAGTVPPVPPPPLSSPAAPALFDDSGPEPIPPTFMTRNEREMDSINNRPRRLGGPLAAVAVVAVLVVVLIVTGLHSTTPSHSGHHASTQTTVQTHSSAHAPVTNAHHQTAPSTTTTTTAPVPVVSAPASNSSQSATYTVGSSNYTLALSANAECWMEATNTTTGAVLFSGTLFSGQSHTVMASGPVTVVTGAPSAFAATVNGVAVNLPQGYQAPFTLKFQTPPASG